MIELGPGWVIPAAEVEFRFVRSGGPGGQNVNKVATKVELRLNLSGCSALNPGQVGRLVSTYSSHVTQAGDLLITSDRFRTQLQNQRDAVERLVAMVRAVRWPPKRRVGTKVPRASKRRRLVAKRERSQVKKLRRSPKED